MARKFAEAFYHSKPWKKCRASFISKRKAIDGGLCQDCHKRPGFIVHHKIELTPDNINNPDISLNHSNLKYVCKLCHETVESHSYRRKHVQDEIRYTFDAQGNPVPVERGDTHG